MNLENALPAELAAIEAEVIGYARAEGLDFAEVRFVLLDFDQINQVAAYDGFPTRYPHWRFGMEYERMRKSYAYGLHRIYEMVINTEPCYAYLLASNLTTDQKLVMAHVYGHADFFKNNLWFAHTNRHMLDDMANARTRIQRYMDKYGVEDVENFVDNCLSLENLIDIHSPGVRRMPNYPVDPLAEAEEQVPGRMPSKAYMDTYINPPEFLAAQKKKESEEQRNLRNQ